MGAWAVLDNLRLEFGSYTHILHQGGSNPDLIGQMHHAAGERSSRLTFITPEIGLTSPGLSALLESLAWTAGERGACSLLAEVEETNPAFETLRRAGFSVYGWQRVWKIKEQPGTNHIPSVWVNATDLDSLPIRALYQALVPPLVQGAEPLADRGLTGMIYEQTGELLAYVEPTYGPRGIYLTPLIHPAVEDVLRLVRSLLNGISFHLGRPVYLSIRSYQAWLENALSELDAEAGERQALMVKHLVVQQRAPAFAAARNGTLDNRQPAMIVHPVEGPPLPFHPVRFKRSHKPRKSEQESRGDSL